MASKLCVILVITAWISGIFGVPPKIPPITENEFNEKESRLPSSQCVYPSVENMKELRPKCVGDVDDNKRWVCSLILSLGETLCRNPDWYNFSKTLIDPKSLDDVVKNGLAICDTVQRVKQAIAKDDHGVSGLRQFLGPLLDADDCRSTCQSFQSVCQLHGVAVIKLMQGMTPGSQDWLNPSATTKTPDSTGSPPQPQPPSGTGVTSLPSGKNGNVLQPSDNSGISPNLHTAPSGGSTNGSQSSGSNDNDRRAPVNGNASQLESNAGKTATDAQPQTAPVVSSNANNTSIPSPGESTKPADGTPQVKLPSEDPSAGGSVKPTDGTPQVKPLAEDPSAGRPAKPADGTPPVTPPSEAPSTGGPVKPTDGTNTQPIVTETTQSKPEVEEGNNDSKNKNLEGGKNSQGTQDNSELAEGTGNEAGATSIKKETQNSAAHDEGLESESSGHFMAYFLTAVVLCIAGYVIFHNKQKIIAFIVEGRSGRQRRRLNGAEYKKLQSNVEEVMPALDKTTAAKNFIY